MDKIKVSAAIIIKKNQVLCCTKTKGEYRGLYEFPGGKLEEGEDHTAALKREIREELDCEIEVGEQLYKTIFDYQDFTVIIEFYHCRLHGAPKPMEGQDVLWRDVCTIDSQTFLPADRKVVEWLKEMAKRGEFNGVDDLYYRRSV